MSLDLWGMRGWMRKPIVVMSEGQPVLSLAMQGTVTRALEVWPEHLNLGQVERGAVEDRLILVAATTDKAIRVTNAKGLTPDIECKVEPLAEGKGYAVRVSLKPEPGALEVKSGVRILLDYPDNPVVEVPISARIVNDVDVLPTRLVIGGSGKDASSRYIVLRGQKVQAFKLSLADSDLPVTATIQKAEEGYRVSVTPKADWSELHGKELVFQTDVETMKEIRIPIVIGDLER